MRYLPSKLFLQARLKPHYKKPFIWGRVCTTTVALLASFRISKFTGAFLSKAKTGEYQFENLQKKKPTSKQEASDARSSIQIVILLSSSLLAGASTALFLTDEVKMQNNDLANIPLVKGRSLRTSQFFSEQTMGSTELQLWCMLKYERNQ